MRVIAADSGAAILDSHFEPRHIVASAAVFVEPPYRNATTVLAKPIFFQVEKGNLLIIHELELCQELLKENRADVIHLDLSMGGVLVEEISPIQLRRKARSSVLEILPRIRKLATDVRRVFGIDVLAIGKESVPVRIAELTTGAYAILYTCEKVIKSKVHAQIILGLPSKCQPRFTRNGITLQSLIAAEHDLCGYVEDSQRFLEKVEIEEMPNPRARGFRVLKINPL